MSSLNELQSLIQEKYGIEPSALDPHASMREKGLDSLALVEFLFAVEDRFQGHGLGTELLDSGLAVRSMTSQSWSPASQSEGCGRHGTVSIRRSAP